MKHLAPACYRTFACAGGSCPDSCCRAGWEIVPDAETLTRYETLTGPAVERVRSGIVQGTEPLLRQTDGRVCVLLDEDGLCHVQRSFGHEALCRVCREYPRFRREFGGLTEHGVSLSCPTAYALATGAPPVWARWEDEGLPIPNELDPETYLRLRRGRALALDLLVRTELPLARRLAMVWKLAERMQAAPERCVRHDWAIALRRWSCLPARRSRTKLEVGSALGALARRFAALELLSPDWADALRRFIRLADNGRLSEDVLRPEQPEVYARWLWYSLYKYWLDALDDGNLSGRVARSLLMLQLGLAMDNALPGEGPFLQRLSREIEHCEQNLNALLSADEAWAAAPLRRGKHPRRLAAARRNGFLRSIGDAEPHR